jgi:RluA family pseudouridine synthase
MKRFTRPKNRFMQKGLRIVHEDKDILVVNKPAGLLTMGTDLEKERTAYYALTDYIRKGASKSKKRIFIVHRLDKDTSGILIFAKTPEAKRALQSNWEDTQKTYLAVVEGCPKKRSDTITSYLMENKANRVYSTPDRVNGKLAKTEYKVVRRIGDVTLLEINLLTGRKNQIRVHLSEMGHPVVGDRKYGAGKSGAKRLGLHAKSITFKHPYSGETVSFDTEPPPSFNRFFGPHKEKPPSEATRD